jgi:hypothetical protein
MSDMEKRWYSGAPAATAEVEWGSAAWFNQQLRQQAKQNGGEIFMTQSLKFVLARPQAEQRLERWYGESK